MTWWWCLKHSRPEQDSEVDVRAADRVGPYPTKEQAESWREQFAARNERWDREDAEWESEGKRPDSG